jgi:hypothetical protein
VPMAFGPLHQSRKPLRSVLFGFASILRVLEPLLGPSFPSLSFGFRPR